MEKAALIIMRCFEYFISSLNQKKVLYEMKFASGVTEDIYMKEYSKFQSDDTLGLYENNLQTCELLLRRRVAF